MLIYLCLGVTNDGVGWLIGASRQSVERILGGLYRKLRIPSRRDAPQGVPTLLESRTRLCCEATVKGLVNPHLLREEDAELRQLGEVARADARPHPRQRRSGATPTELARRAARGERSVARIRCSVI